MKASDIAAILERIAPSTLAYKGEEMGFIVGNENKGVKVLAVTERPTVGVLQEAIEKQVNMLVIHEPLYQSKKTMLVDSNTLLFIPNIKREELVMQGEFCVYRYHSNWDDAEEGNNVTLAKKLELSALEEIPYGRIGKIQPTTLGQFVQQIKQSLDCKHVLVVGNENTSIEKVAVVAGSGNGLTELMEIAKQKGADVYVSGDIQDSRARYAKELGLAVVDAGDYFTENPGAKHLAELLQQQLPEITTYFLDPGQPWNWK